MRISFARANTSGTVNDERSTGSCRGGTSARNFSRRLCRRMASIETRSLPPDLAPLPPRALVPLARLALLALRKSLGSRSVRRSNGSDLEGPRPGGTCSSRIRVSPTAHGAAIGCSDARHEVHQPTAVRFIVPPKRAIRSTTPPRSATGSLRAGERRARAPSDDATILDRSACENVI